MKKPDGNTEQFISLKKQNTFYRNIFFEPKTLHPIKSVDYNSSLVQSYILESLLKNNPDTFQWEPSLAKRWEKGQDGKTFVFHLYRGLKWSDDKPLTVKDVKFTLEVYKNPAYLGARHITSLKKIKEAKIIDDYTIQFTTKNIDFKNFSVISNMSIIPEHIYRLPENSAPTKKNKNSVNTQNPKMNLNRTIIGSGPYKILQYQKGKMLVLTKNNLWFGKHIPSNKGQWNFKNIVFRFIASKQDAFLRIQTGELDFMRLSAREFERQNFKTQKGTEVKKVKYSTLQNSQSSYIGFNLTNPVFKDKKTRKALAHLLNRQFMNEKFGFNHYTLATGPWMSWSEYADSSIKSLLFDPKAAARLLKSAGWEDTNKDGILERAFEGHRKKFAFTILAINKSSNLEKYLTIFQEDLKKAGIHLSIRFLEWSVLSRLLDEKRFDAILFGEAYSVDIDARPWHSERIRKGGFNFISYFNPKVDILIEKAEQQIDRKKRINILRKVYRLIADETPCIFFFDYPYQFYVINKRIHTPKPAFKYHLGEGFWSIKKKKSNRTQKK